MFVNEKKVLALSLEQEEYNALSSASLFLSQIGHKFGVHNTITASESQKSVTKEEINRAVQILSFFTEHQIFEI